MMFVVSFIFHISFACLSSGPNDKMVTHRIYESGPGEFIVEYLPTLTGIQKQLIMMIVTIL